MLLYKFISFLFNVFIRNRLPDCLYHLFIALEKYCRDVHWMFFSGWKNEKEEKTVTEVHALCWALWYPSRILLWIIDNFFPDELSSCIDRIFCQTSTFSSAPIYDVIFVVYSSFCHDFFSFLSHRNQCDIYNHIDMQFFFSSLRNSSTCFWISIDCITILNFR